MKVAAQEDKITPDWRCSRRGLSSIMNTDGHDGGEVTVPLQRFSGAAQKLTQFSSGLSRPFIQRPVMTMLLTVSVLVFGILTYNQLAVNDLPAVDYPVISVTASYPGADPVTMANTIATPLEKQFTQIPGHQFDHELKLAGQHQHNHPV